MFLKNVPNIHEILKELLNRIKTGPFEVSINTVSDVYLNNSNIGGGYRIHNSTIDIAGLTIKLSHKNKSTNWRDCIEILYQDKNVILDNNEELEKILIEIVDYYKENY